MTANHALVLTANATAGFAAGCLDRPELESLPDTELALRCRDASPRDLTAFRVLLVRHEPAVFDVCHQLVGDTVAAEATGDDVFIAVLHEIGDFDPAVVNFRPWLFRRVIRLCRERGMPVSGGVFAGLDAAAREIAALRLFGKLSAREIAAVLGLAEPELRVRLWRALEAMGGHRTAA
ncbi:MAG: sigma-70 family RNA polymerase sigma factor [Verrucomicrobiae bacterium]|nr:sigma-70 family RNA polymerase sigma factor [Verrucomicrobiae bacterium]MCP5551824.1 sigma-70 family RNA polymerase sigma factor [Akkermansiaceae bacterium]